MNEPKTLTIKDLTALLAPAISSLKSIEKSLSTLADLQIAQEFTPDQSARAELYKKLDMAHHRVLMTQTALQDELDALQKVKGSISHAAYVEAHGKEAADSVWAPFQAAFEANAASNRQLRELEGQFPALVRLNQLAPRPPKVHSAPDAATE
uniref:Uncharacterized protein n=1 Tax=Pseudomonas syringae pv. actinidiae TaxID=103796 RepID=A0A2P0QER9_PSESF|nr:hypothetical protein [Pseudomonas syringae]ARO44878.1 hypothetical protein [Pseudomonas syringae pv. actinidiae]